jgi:hypothetical protein
MLQQICEHIHNYFIKDRHDGIYEIADGVIPLSFLEGQRFLIVGSALNDGMYTYHEDGIKNDDDTEAVGLHDETFTGTICALAVPPAVIALSGEINSWVEKYGEVVNSPYSSENVIGVYSYQKAQVGGQANGSPTTASWENVFNDRLNRWRKVAF